MLVLLKTLASASDGLVWGLFQPHCYRRYFVQQDLFGQLAAARCRVLCHRRLAQRLTASALFAALLLSDLECLKLLISKSLGYAIITGAVIVKLPQIAKLLQSGRADSIAPSMFVLENIGYTVSWAYNHRHGHPFSTYGETAFLLLQGFVLVFLVFRINGQLNAAFAAATAAYAAFAVALFTVAPDSTLSALQSLSIPLFAASRLPQIAANWRQRSTGQLAFLTTALNALGSLARVFTTVQELRDPLMLTGVCVSTLLNGILLLQMLWYWNRSPKQRAATAIAGGEGAVTAAAGSAVAVKRTTVETSSATETEEAKPVKRRGQRGDGRAAAAAL